MHKALLTALLLACAGLPLQAGSEPQGPTGNAARLQRQMEMTDKPWTQLLSQNGIDLKPGETYRLTFWAKASQVMMLRVLAKIDQPPWTGLQEKKLELGPEWTQQEVFLQSDLAEPGHTRLEFRYGGTEAGDIWIADVELRPDADTSAPNMLPNGRFEDDLTNWYIEGLRPGAFAITVEPAKGGAAP